MERTYSQSALLCEILVKVIFLMKRFSFIIYDKIWDLKSELLCTGILLFQLTGPPFLQQLPKQHPLYTKSISLFFMPKNPLQTTKKNRLTKLQNPALAPVTVTEIQFLMKILTSSLEVVKNAGAKPVAVAIKEAKLLIVHQPMEQTTPNLLTQAITARTPVLPAIKSAIGAMSAQALRQKTSCYWQYLRASDW